jgi:hypothetical protein
VCTGARVVRARPWGQDVLDPCTAVLICSFDSHVGVCLQGHTSEVTGHTSEVTGHTSEVTLYVYLRVSWGQEVSMSCPMPPLYQL